MLSSQARQELLGIARRTLEDYLIRREFFEVGAPAPELHENRGAFVTLEQSGTLRGCIGHLVADRPLYLTVQEMAIQAATGDPRFPSVTAGELIEIAIEISVLSPLRRIQGVEAIRVGEHGLVVGLGGRRGLLLPQVAAREGWDAQQFLAATCRKAGLPLAVLRDPRLTIEVFSAEVFGEES